MYVVEGQTVGLGLAPQHHIAVDSKAFAARVALADQDITVLLHFLERVSLRRSHFRDSASESHVDSFEITRCTVPTEQPTSFAIARTD